MRILRQPEAHGFPRDGGWIGATVLCDPIDLLEYSRFLAEVNILVEFGDLFLQTSTCPM